MSYRELMAATHGRAQGISRPDARFTSISIDTRTLEPGDLFWALSGPRHDGHHYLEQAQDKSAAAAVVARPQPVPAGMPAVIVEDTLVALGEFARWYRQQFDTLVIAVTGSVGKTTTRHMLHTSLSTRFQGVESPHNYNNQFGVPLSLLGIDSRQEFAVLELAASRKHEIGKLAGLCLPEVAVITAISPVHLDEFGSLENIARTKAQLLEALPASGFAVLNGDDELVRRIGASAECRIILVGERPDNDLVAEWVRVENGRLRFHVDNTEFDVPVVGRHHLTSAMVCVAVGREVAMTDEEIASGLRRFDAVPGRCRPQWIGPWIVIDDTYNASPASMAAACRVLRDWNTDQQRIAVFGDMLALGEQTEHFHQQLGPAVAAAGCSRLIAIGPQAATVAGTAKTAGMDAGCLGACRDVDTAKMLLDLWLEPGDLVLVKGSRDMHMEQFLDDLRQLARRQGHHITSPDSNGRKVA